MFSLHSSANSYLTLKTLCRHTSCGVSWAQIPFDWKNTHYYQFEKHWAYCLEWNCYESKIFPELSFLVLPLPLTLPQPTAMFNSAELIALSHYVAPSIPMCLPRMRA